MEDATRDPDFLYGAPAIGTHMSLRPRQVYHLIEKASLPVFRLGRIVCARRSTLNAWLAEREAAALKSGCLEH